MLYACGDDLVAGECSDNLIGSGGGGYVPIVWSDAEKSVTNAAADGVGLEAVELSISIA